MAGPSTGCLVVPPDEEPVSTFLWRAASRGFRGYVDGGKPSWMEPGAGRGGWKGTSEEAAQPGAMRAAPRRPHVAAPEAPEAPGMERARPGPSPGTAPAPATGRMGGTGFGRSFLT